MTGSVVVAYAHEAEVSHSWMSSMWRLREYDWAREGGPQLHSRPLALRCNTGRLVQTRNYAVRLFLDRPELADAEWLWMVDTDMGFEADLLERLLAVADPDTAPVVGALAFAMMETGPDGFNGHRFQIVPTMYMLGTTAEGHGSFCFYGPYPADTMVQVAGTGAACVLIHRSVLERVRAHVDAGGRRWGDTWFDQVADSRNSVVGEDLSFCLRLQALGIPIFVHTGVQTSHHRQVWITEQDYDLAPLSLIDESGHAAPEIAVHIDVGESLRTLAANEHMHPDGMRKLPADLDRYAAIIDATKPEVIVETGTATGASAQWFADHGVDVITVDVYGPADVPTYHRPNGHRIDYVRGDSADPTVADLVARLVAGRRCMVSLDSDHSAPHVAAEIAAYGPLVTAGCYLVVEDGIFAYAPDPLIRQHGLADMVKSPLDAIAECLDGQPGWSRDVSIERLHPTSHHPAGWWVRHG
jgi:cephalosporin hydroxylase